MKQDSFKYIDALAKPMWAMADFIHDHPELGLQEVQAAKLLTDWLEAEGFKVERGFCHIPTAFRAVYEHGEGGINIGLLCEYDALEGLGHGCAHHIQGPAIIAAAAALKNDANPYNYKITVIGTPAEETVSGKIMMLNAGYDFTDLDFALMIHGDVATRTDKHSLALSKYTVTYHGHGAHAAVKPENGRSALDALLLAFQGVEFLREHVTSDVRMHYIVKNCGGTPVNVVPAQAEGEFALRAANSTNLQKVAERFKKVLQGAAMMTETTVDIQEDKLLDNKIPADFLNGLLMDNAHLVHAPKIGPTREKTGSTDFGNVVHRIPGACLRMCFIDDDKAASHSQEYVEAGKLALAHEAVTTGAKILAGTVLDILAKPERLTAIRQEFQQRLKEEQANN